MSDRIRKSTSFSVEGMNHLFDSLRKYAKGYASIRLDFDSEASLTSKDYHNLTGLTRTQFDDLADEIEMCLGQQDAGYSFLI